MKKNIISVIMLSSFVGFVVYATIETRPLQEESSSYNQEISEEVNKIAVEETRTIQKEDNKIYLKLQMLKYRLLSRVKLKLSITQILWKILKSSIYKKRMMIIIGMTMRKMMKEKNCMGRRKMMTNFYMDAFC